MKDFDALILADSPHAKTVLLGLTLVERGWRVATKVGARRVFVLDGPEAARTVRDWAGEGGNVALVVMRAGDQVVHKPLLEPLVRGTGARRMAVGPDGEYAGALWVEGEDVKRVVDAIAAAPQTADRDLVDGWSDAERIEHGDIARHVATTPAERAGAIEMLLRLNIKAEDNPVTRHIYRPLSRPLTRLLLHTPITPNQISYAVGILGLIGCWLTAQPGQNALVWGAATIFFAGVLDGCDGEIARLRLISSPYGAWLDTIVDEITTTGYFIGIAYHVYAHHPEGWIAWSIPIGTLCYVATIYAIYYFCIVVVKVGGSQFYIGTLELAEGPSGWGLREKPRNPSIKSPLLRMFGRWAMYAKTRDFINLAALGLTFLNGYWVIYLGMLIGGVATAMVVMPDHIRLRLQLREIARRGGTPHIVPAGRTESAPLILRSS
ncbi:MAG TPA: CDP-alcohol phosphatidyltransferase family protein [Kofleriaceae bacterium]